jgi:hypothetical protein
MRSLGFSLVAGAVLTAMAAMAQAPTTFQPVGNMKQLMIDIIYPTSDAMFYIERAAPKTEADWNIIRNQALTLAESGNLILMPGRARDHKNWIMESKMLIDLGAKAYQAAQNKDLDGIRALNDPLNAACVTCHQQYRPGYHRRPPAAAPAAQ